LLRLGELALVAGVPCSADAGGFDRHTFLCGQSGSGKTYSLGVILERLLIETDLRLVVLDPNSDFVRLGEVRAGADPALAARYEAAARGVAVCTAEAPGARRLRLQATKMDPATEAALLRLDPIEDREEFAALAALLASEHTPTLEALTDSERPEARRLGLRVRNLGIDRLHSGRAARRARSSMQSTIRMSAASSLTSARCQPARNRHSLRGRYSATCGDAAKSETRS
jgi:Helicase HerA, central domain